MKPVNYLLPVIAITLYCIIPETINAQCGLQGQPSIDSLLRELAKAKDDTSKAKTFYDLSIVYASKDNNAALHYADTCMNISKRDKWTKGIGLAYHAYSNAQFEISEFTVSQQNSLKAYDIFKRLNDKKNMALALKMIGISYDMLGYYAKALENHFASLRLFEDINDKYGIGTCDNNIGSVYYSMSEYDKAIEYYSKALVNSRELNNKHLTATALDNIATVFTDKRKYDSASVYNLQAIKIFQEINCWTSLNKCYYNRGDLLMKLHNAKSAYEYDMRAVEIDKRLNIQLELSEDYGGIGNLYLSLSKDSAENYIISPLLNMDKKSLLQKAQQYFTRALALVTYTGLLSQTEEGLGNYRKALAFHKEYMLYKDSIYNDENKKKIAALENQRLAEVKDKEIQLLNKDKALQASEIKRQTLIKNIIIAAVLVAAIFTFFLTRSFIRRRKVMFDKQVLQTEMKALRAQMNPHFIFNSLHSINRYIMENDKVNASEYLSKFARLMRLVLENSREQEVPLENDLAALELYMQLESLRFENRFQYKIEIDPGIDKENTLIPPLMLQPFAENAIVHGVKDKEDGLIKINIHSENDNMIRCVVEDNGKGRGAPPVTEESNRKRKSLGMKITQERLNIINQLKKAKAVVHIFDLKDAENKPGGLRIELLLPLQLAF
jgi:tetratricopeptide (TPR) repeat protein